MTHKLLSLYGLKWNPFCPDVPTEALLRTPKLESFCWRIENQLAEGGFALISGDPGTGKSVALRLLAERLSAVREVIVGVVSHPQSGVSDFYRELGDLFGVPLSPRNRWGSFKALREKWQAHLETTLTRPVLLIDEAQEMQPGVLAELRILSSLRFDSRSAVTVVFCGDGRLTERFRSDELLPLASRIRIRLQMEYASPEQLGELLSHALTQAGNPVLMTDPLQRTLCEHAAGNYRTLTALAAELLDAAVQRQAPQLDEQLYFEVFAAPAGARARPSLARAKTR